MSSYLWKFYLEDDVDSFRRLLAEAGYVTGPHQHKSVHRPPQEIAGSAASSSFLGTSGAISSTSKARKASAGGGPGGGKARASHFAHGHWTNLTLARADINLRDRAGLTILHHASSSRAPNAIGFATALIDHPLVDLYLQDEENGWTALHRALYFGNVTTARAILTRDMSDAVGRDHSGVALHAGGIIRVKDNEGNSPFDLFNATVATIATEPVSRRVVGPVSLEDPDYGVANSSSNSSSSSISSNPDADCCCSGCQMMIGYDLEDPLHPENPGLASQTKLEGDEVYMFGSNKNLNLGFGDEDDRQYPERVTLRRPDHLCSSVSHHQRQPSGEQGFEASSRRLPSGGKPMPVSARYKPLAIRDVVISKFHTAIVTADELANLYVCGYGAGGRLGTGDEATRFTFVCVDGGGLAPKRVIGVGLGQNHTLAVTSDGAVFTWGTNTHGQLGYALAQPNPGDDGLVQASPRRLLGPLKREIVIGTAASRIHSVVHTAYNLYTFGKNEGQLGLYDADDKVQPIPTHVGYRRFSSRIRMVSAIDGATVCLLDDNEVWVFANYGYARLLFPAEDFNNHFVGPTLGASRHGSKSGRIFKIFSGGDTICALSGVGDVFALRVKQKPEPGPAEGSIANPNKARGALTHPQRIWSFRKASMAVRDLGVGQDGSIIICTQSGSVWRRERRTKLEKVKAGRVGGPKSKDYKFSRVPGLTKIAAVRSNTVGVFSAIRKDDDIMKAQITVEGSSLQADTTRLLSFCDVLMMEDSVQATPWSSAISKDPTSYDAYIDLPRRVVGLEPAALEADVAAAIVSRNESSTDLAYDVDLCTTTSPVRIPAHRFILARSPAIGRALAECSRPQDGRAPDLFSVSSGHGGRMEIVFQGLDFLVLFNLVLYLYADRLVSFWAPPSTLSMPQHAPRLRQARAELLRVASSLELRQVEMATWFCCASMDAFRVEMESALAKPEFSDHADTIVELDGAEVKVHSALMCQRCPFFHGLFRGRAAGQWLSTRDREDGSKMIKVDLAHVDPAVFQFVLRYVYADADENMFEDAVTADVDEFLDLVVEVLSVANELMLERLCQICQKVLGRFVTARNACPLLNAVAPSSVTAFKDACLKYLCFGLEGMLENQSVVPFRCAAARLLTHLILPPPKSPGRSRGGFDA